MKDHAPSAERNRDDILPALKDFLPATGTILEIASGTGQHAVHFAPHFPEATWQASERRAEALVSIRAWAAEAAVPNLADPLLLDVSWDRWPIESAEAIVNINMLHISPWTTCEALLAGAARVLAPGAPLFYYGALIRADRQTAESNLAFDRWLRDRDSSWGIRDFEAVVARAEREGLELCELREMPNNNSVLVLRRV